MTEKEVYELLVREFAKFKIGDRVVYCNFEYTVCKIDNIRVDENGVSVRYDLIGLHKAWGIHQDSLNLAEEKDLS